jgi:hypothetical protein
LPVKTRLPVVIYAYLQPLWLPSLILERRESFSKIPFTLLYTSPKTILSLQTLLKTNDIFLPSYDKSSYLGNIVKEKMLFTNDWSPLSQNNLIKNTPPRYIAKLNAFIFTWLYYFLIKNVYQEPYTCSCIKAVLRCLTCDSIHGRAH